MSKYNLQNLPPELLVNIFSYFTPIELSQVIAPVCKTWWLLSKTPCLWEKLNFSRTPSTCGSKKAYYDLFRRCSSLHTLLIWSTAQIQSLIECSDDLPHLTNLTLGRPDNKKIMLSIISSIVSKFPQIEVLYLNGIIESFEATARCIVNLKSLRSLTVDGLNLDDTSVTTIAKNCDKLQRLSIRSMIITDEALKALATFCYDTLLDLSSSCWKLTDTSLVYLSSCKKLKVLELVYGSSFTDEGLQALCNLPCLVKLKLNRCSGVTANGWCRFFSNVTLTNLKTLQLRELHIDDAGLQIAAKGANKNLQHLLINRCSNISDKGLEVVIDNCSSLNSLILWYLDNVTGKSLIHIPSKLPNLELLRLSKCQNIIPEVADELAKVVHGMRRTRLLHE